MKAISLTQPWATLVAIGAKKIETRSWSKAYRGPLAIHASKKFPEDARALCWEEPFRTALTPTGLVDYTPYEDMSPGDEELLSLPLGAIVALVELVDIRRVVRGYRAGAVLDGGIDVRGDEYQFGDYEPGRYGWGLDKIRPLATPIPCRGALGLWDVPDAIAAAITAQLAPGSDR